MDTWNFLCPTFKSSELEVPIVKIFVGETFGSKETYMLWRNKFESGEIAIPAYCIPTGKSTFVTTPTLYGHHQASNRTQYSENIKIYALRVLYSGFRNRPYTG